MAFSPGGEVLASVSWDGTLRLWDPWSGDLLLTTNPPGLLFAFDRRGGRLASMGSDLVVWEFAPGVERRVLRSVNAPSSSGGQALSIDPSGRLLASAWGLWDLASGRPLDDSHWWRRGFFLFQRAGRALLATRGEGSLRWPFEVHAGTDGDVLLWGRQERLPEIPTGAALLASDAAARRLVVIGPDSSVTALDLEPAARKRTLGTHPGANQVSVSPDGRWAASGTFNHGRGIKVWDLEAGTLVRELEASAGAQAFFSPRGRWLAIATPVAFRVEEAGGWTPWRSIPREVDTNLPGPLCWSSDDALLAMAITQSDVLLLDVAAGAVAGRLGSAQPRAAQALEFTPDGDKLIIGRANATVEVWDLLRIREGLAALGLDLAGGQPSGNRPPAPPRPLRIERFEEESAGGREDEGPGAESAENPRDLAELLRLCAALQRGGKWKEAIRRYQEALERTPDSAELLNDLAWTLAIAPEEYRDPPRAVALAEAAVRASGGRPACLNTLGVAEYRAGKFREAVDTLLRGARAADGVTAWDGFFIAMSLKRQGLDALAGDYYRNAVRWMERHPDMAKEELRELRAFRDEAAEVLGEKERSD